MSRPAREIVTKADSLADRMIGLRALLAQAERSLDLSDGEVIDDGVMALIRAARQLVPSESWMADLVHMADLAEFRE